MELDIDKIKAREGELIKFADFLPMEILNVIDAVRRNDYLKNIGKFDEVQKLNLAFRRNFKLYGLEYKEKILKDWIRNNPQFEDLVIFD